MEAHVSKICSATLRYREYILHTDLLGDAACAIAPMHNSRGAEIDTISSENCRAKISTKAIQVGGKAHVHRDKAPAALEASKVCDTRRMWRVCSGDERDALDSRTVSNASQKILHEDGVQTENGRLEDNNEIEAWVRRHARDASFLRLLAQSQVRTGQEPDM